MPENQGFFITGTDTGVGKTRVAVALARALVARGLRTAVMKPVAAGVIDTPAGPRNDDAVELLGASNVAAAYEDVNPWLLATPASPHLAARAAGVSIRHETILASYWRLAAISDVLIVEGAGGWLAPISATETMADVAEKLALPVILVVGMRLGCLNHALLTREAIRARGLTIRRLDREQARDRNATVRGQYRHADEPIPDAAARRRSERRIGRIRMGSRGREESRKPLSWTTKWLV